MDAQAMRDATDLFDELEDPRVVGRCTHHLIDIVMITRVATMGDTDDWQEIAMFGQVHQGWFKKFLELPGGIPSHDTFERVFAKLDPAQMNRCFERWVTHLDALVNPAPGNNPAPESPGSAGATSARRTISIDGKTLRGSNKARDSTDQKPLHLVSAWSHEAKLVLGQVATDEKSNEVTAIPELLDILDLEGATVTIDAMGCQKAIAQKLHENKADYALALKDNHEHLHTQAALLLAEADDSGGDDGPAITYQTHRTDERGHGREETRVYTTVTLNEHTTHRIDDATRQAWPGLTAVGRVVSTRTVKGSSGGSFGGSFGVKTTTQHRYYLLSDPDVKHFAESVRGHWGIENSAHWVLDVTFGEDANRTSKDHGPENLAILRRLAMNLFRANRDRNKIALKNQRKMIGWDINTVQELLNGVF